MALVEKLSKINLEKNSTHQSVECSYSIIDTPEGKLLQIDTYGSANRQIKGKKSQSIRFSKEAATQLHAILQSL